MNLFLLWTLLTSSCVYFAVSESQCTTPDGGGGSCVSINACDTLMSLLQNLTSANQDHLKQSICGFSANMPYVNVCCPSSQGCTTPDGAKGTCVTWSSCPNLSSIIEGLRGLSIIPEDTIQFIRRYQCDGPDAYSVCCAEPQLPTQPPPEPPKEPKPDNSSKSPNGGCTPTAFPPELDISCCGVEKSSDKIFGGEATAIDEYTWLSLIEYQNDIEILKKVICGGALISGRYVMTAAHCVIGPVLEKNRLTPVNVRLGEYDTSNPGKDCVLVNDVKDCNEGAITVPIEKTIPHPSYNPLTNWDDIALIRLDEIVKYTDFIRPICLPTVDFTQSSPPGLSLVVAGWGAVSDKQKSSNVKLKVTLPYVELQDCQLMYEAVKLWDGQICAGGEIGKDSCKGDSGGPLMRNNKNNIELVGITSFGGKTCGLANQPGIYTNVYTYLPWIKSQIVD